MLDGDVVRTHLSDDLALGEDDRDTNIGGSGGVAARACWDSGRRRGGLPRRRGPRAGGVPDRASHRSSGCTYAPRSTSASGVIPRASTLAPAGDLPDFTGVTAPYGGRRSRPPARHGHGGPRRPATDVARVTRPPEVTEQPLCLGVRRSGTTLLRVMLDRNSAIAIPDESYFIPQLAHRHPGPSVDVDAFLDDVRRLSTLREWGLPASAVAERLRPGMTRDEAIGAIFAAYAGLRQGTVGRQDPALHVVPPAARTHLPDARLPPPGAGRPRRARSFLSVPRGIMTEGWGHPKDAAGFARLWRTEVEAARARPARWSRPVPRAPLRDVRDSAAELARVCVCRVSFEADMPTTSAARLGPQAAPAALNQPPTTGVRDWRTELAPRRGCFRGCCGRPARGARLRDAERWPPVAEGLPPPALPRDDNRGGRQYDAARRLAPPASAVTRRRGSARRVPWPRSATRIPLSVK